MLNKQGELWCGVRSGLLGYEATCWGLGMTHPKGMVSRSNQWGWIPSCALLEGFLGNQADARNSWSKSPAHTCTNLEGGERGKVRVALDQLQARGCIGIWTKVKT